MSLYLILIFSYFFFFKPLYIIMVLNWAFDSKFYKHILWTYLLYKLDNVHLLALHTQKTPSYYIQCFCIFAAFFIFGLFNLWQLTVGLHYFEYLDMVARTETATTNSHQTGMTALSVLSEKREPIVLVVNRNPSDLGPPPKAGDYRLVL